MKCPKCGFNSFEFYDSCKKCSGDLTGYKQTYSVTSIVLPQEAKARLAALSRSAESAPDQVNDTAVTHDDIFSFNLSDESPSVSAKGNDNPFDFDEPSSNSSKSEDDVFADLLESTSQTDESPFGEAEASFTPAAVKKTVAPAEPGEFDLGNFSWDDSPAETKTTAPGNEGSDDFDSLFGDTKEDPSK
jgi:hypothetical protein